MLLVGASIRQPQTKQQLDCSSIIPLFRGLSRSQFHLEKLAITDIREIPIMRIAGKVTPPSHLRS
jgi:hypothetical protein